jgi:hypothetical protein
MDAFRGRVSTARGGRVTLTYGGVTERSFEHPRFVIARQDTKGADVLVLRLPEGRTALPVFGLEEEAGIFVWLETVGEGWRVAEASEADLAALLRGSCAGVRRIAHPFAEEGVGKGPETVRSREEFLGALWGERGRRGKEAGHEFAPQICAGKVRDFW